ncbi:hypothetical protein E2C01_037492 [Portunus trituberculatus]|uniref:Uncharacterized protein n=1 Tax=Portunus trituberculatus TaxID=210409 RepID=A0A5B7FFS7_PORTR|nr:hypothetical protein [Portunus trituberculatus]
MGEEFKTPVCCVSVVHLSRPSVRHGRRTPAQPRWSVAGGGRHEAGAVHLSGCLAAPLRSLAPTLLPEPPPYPPSPPPPPSPPKIIKGVFLATFYGIVAPSPGGNTARHSNSDNTSNTANT